MPVRAIPYVTGRAFSPRMIAAAIADDREAPETRVFETWLSPGYVDAAGDLNPMARGELQPCADTVNELHANSASLVDQIAAMPPGVYIPLRDLRSVVAETNLECEGEYPGAHGYGPRGNRYGQPCGRRRQAGKKGPRRGKTCI